MFAHEKPHEGVSSSQFHSVCPTLYLATPPLNASSSSTFLWQVVVSHAQTFRYFHYLLPAAGVAQCECECECEHECEYIHKYVTSDAAANLMECVSLSFLLLS